MRILVIEDDSLVRDALRRALTDFGFAVDAVANTISADAALRSDVFDLAVVDIGLPGEDGLQFVRRLRRAGQALPVLILTARDEISDRVGALDLGADDYLVKPFALPELGARCRALIRRARAATSSEIRIGALELDIAHKRATIAAVPVELTRREWAVLEYLAFSAGKLIAKNRLISAIADFDDDLTPNAIEVYVSRLRAKLGDAVTIRAVRGLGYRLDEPTR